MKVDSDLRDYISANFKLISEGFVFPKPRTLSLTLEGLLPQGNKKSTKIDAADAKYFPSAAVEIWLRSVHSFLVSAALTDSSPIWASVAGYYSSHYAIRGVAHLLGHFQLFKMQKLVQLSIDQNDHVCTFKNKNGRDGGEHKIYWKLIANSSLFQDDILFARTNADSDLSDAQHRNFGNYADHVYIYPKFAPLDESKIKDRIEKISKIALNSAPLPRVSKFPDLEAVQLVAYHRLVKFREVLDEILGDTNRFWTECRSPKFATDYMDFQLVETPTLAQPAAN